MSIAQSHLEEIFGLKEFRKGQAEIIASVLAGKDTLAVMPTGGGKSLCYQLPAFCQPGITVVISPLISLMRDQVNALTAKGIPAGCVHSGMSMEEREKTFKQIALHPSFLLYLSPERVQSGGFINWVKTAPVSLFAIDEAHCVSQWGHDFRPDYNKIAFLRTLRPEVPILGTTATATPQVLADISTQLQLNKPSTHIYGFYRPNLYYQVEYCVGDSDKMSFLRGALKSTPKGKIIIYCGTRSKCKELFDDLSKEFPKMGYYHAGLTSEQRDKIQDSYEQGEIRILVATNAFGMGVDQPDVRLVIHDQMPANIESYYQEVGRAGRDGQHSTCLLLYAKKDKGLQSFFIRESKAPMNIRENRWRTLDAIIQFCEGGECRHAGILTYFKDTERITACGHCDICVPKSDRKIKPATKTLLRKSQPEPTTTKKKTTKAKVEKAPPSKLTKEENDLMTTIKQWRKDYAKANDMPAFMVFSNKTLEDLARKHPKTLEDLEKVYGIGPQKIEAFGKELLEALQ